MGRASVPVRHPSHPRDIDSMRLQTKALSAEGTGGTLEKRRRGTRYCSPQNKDESPKGAATRNLCVISHYFSNARCTLTKINRYSTQYSIVKVERCVWDVRNQSSELSIHSDHQLTRLKRFQQTYQMFTQIKPIAKHKHVSIILSTAQ